MARKKPVTTLNRLQPGTSGHNLAVRVLEKEVVIDRRDGSGEHLKIEECVVGDGTGRFTVSVRNGKPPPSCVSAALLHITNDRCLCRPMRPDGS